MPPVEVGSHCCRHPNVVVEGLDLRARIDQPAEKAGIAFAAKASLHMTREQRPFCAFLKGAEGPELQEDGL